MHTAAYYVDAFSSVFVELNRADDEYNQVLKNFQDKWEKNPPGPLADCIFKVIASSELMDQFHNYRANLPDKTIEELFHGTTMKCNLISTKQACMNSDCGICGISSRGFVRNKIGNNIPHFRRFGKAFYLASSSKCHEYTQGFTMHRAMLLCSVLPGIKHKTEENMKHLCRPPEGHNSVEGITGDRLNFGELAVYDSEAILPKYVIVYQKDDIKKIA